MSNQVKTNLKDDLLIKSIIADHKPFANLKQTLTYNIATLTDEFIKEPVVKATLLILASRRLIELYNSKIKKLETGANPLPRSLRVKINLTCSEKTNNDANEFLSLRSEAAILTEEWQQKMKGLFIRTKELDKKRAIMNHKERFFNECTNILTLKACYALNLMRDNSEAKTELEKRGGAKTLIAITLLKFFEQADPTINSSRKYIYVNQKNNLLKLNETSFSLNREEIKKGLLDKVNEDKAKQAIDEKILNYQDLDLDTAIDSITRMLTYCLTTMTISTFAKYDDIIHKEKALALTTATLSATKQLQTTEEVAEAIAEEPSMDSKRMNDYIRKQIRQELQKEAKNESSSRSKNNKRKNQSADAQKQQHSSPSPKKKSKPTRSPKTNNSQDQIKQKQHHRNKQNNNQFNRNKKSNNQKKNNSPKSPHHKSKNLSWKSPNSKRKGNRDGSPKGRRNDKKE